jgi:hypothetical protein
MSMLEEGKFSDKMAKQSPWKIRSFKEEDFLLPLTRDE